MIYEYKCIKCEHTFDVVKSYKDMDRNEWCERCEAPAERMFVPRKLHIYGASVEHPEYNPGLGTVVKNKAHRKEIAKRKGLIEVGSESVESIHKHQDKILEDKRRKRWEDD